MTTKLEEYYNKFNEEKRLNSRHGQIEYRISMKYIHQYLHPGAHILDVGAGTGRYSIPLFEEGYHVTAIELVQHNLGMLRQKNPDVPAFRGNALNLKRIPDQSQDLVLLFGPMYHLHGMDSKQKALEEAKRVVKPGGYIFVAYIMNEYAFLTYAIKERHLLESIEQGKIDHSFHIHSSEEDLYDYVRLEDIYALSEAADLDRVTVFSPDGPANHMRPFINQLTEEEFEIFIRYQETVCERTDLLGASAHIVDILQKKTF